MFPINMENGLINNIKYYLLLQLCFLYKMTTNTKRPKKLNITDHPTKFCLSKTKPFPTFVFETLTK